MDNDSRPPAKLKKKDEVLGNVTVKAFDSAPMVVTADELAETLCISLRQVWRLKTKATCPSLSASVAMSAGDYELAVGTQVDALPL